MKLLTFAAPLAALCLPLPSLAQAAEPIVAPITIGEVLTISSPQLGEDRNLAIYLPAGYADGTEHYPVLYLIDGGLEQDFLHIAGTTVLNALWGRSRPVIVVGIETKDRRAELIGSPGNSEERAAYPTAGQSARFRDFVRDTVKPLIETRYRTTGEDAVIGESLAGLFIVETWLREPGLFDAYAAIDPSLWWDDISLGKAAAELVVDGSERGPIYLTYSDEGPMTERGVELVAEAAGARACLLPRPDLTHATAYHAVSPQALQFLFPEENGPPDFDGFEVPCGAESAE